MRRNGKSALHLDAAAESVVWACGMEPGRPSTDGQASPRLRVWPLSGGLFPLGTDRGEGTPAPNPETVGWSRPALRPVEQRFAKRKTGVRTTLRIAKWVQLHGGLFIRQLVWNTQKAKLERRAK